jgi:NADH-quinone oxidoreductase subunit D
MPDIKTEVMTVNMGPQHPSTHGVLRLVLELDGETVLSAAPTIGFLHTGIEKTTEQKKWQQVIPLVERMDYLSAQSNSMAYCLSVERLLGLEIPQRVRDIRVLIAELQRINSHLVWLGTHGMEVGAVSVMLYCFRERELLLNINELLAGFRLFPSYMRVGGLREDLPRGFHDAVRAFLDRFGPKLDEYEDLLTKNEIYLKRTQDVGVISKADAVAYGLVGPIARSAGVDYDVRK